MLSPVNILGKRSDVSRRQVLGATQGNVGACVVELGGGLVSVHNGSELVVQQISKLIHGHVVTFVALVSKPVVLLNLGFVLHPDFHPEALLLAVLPTHGVAIVPGVSLAVLQFPGLPFLYDRLEGRDGGGSLKADETEQESKLHLAPTGVFVL